MCWMVTRQAPARMAFEAGEACARHGLRALKIQGGQGRDTDLKTIAAVKSAVGSGVEVFVDANGSYSREESLEYVRELAQAGVTVVEDPCPLSPDAAYSALQRDCRIP